MNKIIYYCLRSIILLFNKFAERICRYCIFMLCGPKGLRTHLSNLGRKKRNLKSRIVCTKVVLLPVSVVSVGPSPCSLHRVLCRPDGKLTPAQDMALFVHGPPSLKRVMLSVLNGQRFSLCARSKQRAKLVSKLHSFCILILQASFV